MAKAKRKGRRNKARSYISNPAPKKKTARRRRKRAISPVHFARVAARKLRYRRNPSSFMMDSAALLGGGVAGAVAVPKLVSMIPVGTNLIKNLGMVALGSALTYMSFKKRSYLGLGVGMGTAVAGATRAITNAVPMLAGDGEYTQDEQEAITSDLMGDDGEFDYNPEYLNAPAAMAAPAMFGADPFTNSMF